MDLARARARALAAHPGSPLLTDRTQGRVELSHATFDNWVTKTVNFLRMEAEMEQGDTIGLDLPLHWMTAVWVVSAWEAGCDVTFEGPADLWVSTSEGDVGDVLVSTDPFGMAPPPIDARAQWYFPSDVRGMPDALVFPAPSSGSAPGMTPEQLFSAAEAYAGKVGLTAGGRLRVAHPSHDLNALIGAALAVDAAVVYGPADGEGPTATA